MSIITVREHLKKFNLDSQIMELESSSATVRDASIALGCSEAEIAKTLSFMLNDKAILIVTAGDKKIDNSKYKSTFGAKAKMLAFGDVERLIGHTVGGVCPFGINDNVDVYLDESLKNFNYVYPACGSSHSAIKLTIPQLEETSGYKQWVDVCKDISEIN